MGPVLSALAAVAVYLLLGRLSPLGRLRRVLWAGIGGALARALLASARGDVAAAFSPTAEVYQDLFHGFGVGLAAAGVVAGVELLRARRLPPGA